MTDIKAILALVAQGVLRIDDDGAIYRCAAFGRTGKLRQIEPKRCDYIGAKGYRSVRVNVKGVAFRASAHQVIWVAKNGPIPRGLEPNHKDGDRGNNRLSNLELLTRGENNKHSYEKLGRLRPAGERNARHKLTEAQVAAIRSLKGKASSRTVGKRFGVTHRIVLRIWSGAAWKPHDE
jgi:hypothetical protein